MKLSDVLIFFMIIFLTSAGAIPAAGDWFITLAVLFGVLAMIDDIFLHVTGDKC